MQTLQQTAPRNPRFMVYLQYYADLAKVTGVALLCKEMRAPLLCWSQRAVCSTLSLSDKPESLLTAFARNILFLPA